MVPQLTFGEEMLRILVAAGLGAALGMERELRGQQAGVRTHLLVAVGSCLFTLVGAYGFEDFFSSGPRGNPVDPTRIAAQIVTGIGFLGAGAILRQGTLVRGLTTAATLWVVAAIGLAAGAGYYGGAVATTIVVLLALGPGRVLSRQFLHPRRPHDEA